MESGANPNFIKKVISLNESELIESFEQQEEEQTEAIPEEPLDIKIPTASSSTVLNTDTAMYDEQGKLVDQGLFVVPTVKLVRQLEKSNGIRDFALGHAYSQYDRNKLFAVF